MPIEIEDYYFEEQKMQIREFYSDGLYIEGIKAAVVTLSNLSTASLREKYYVSFCKLLAMGYRKTGKTKLALDVINKGISFVTTKLDNDSSAQWNSELATLYMNLGVIYENTGNHIGAVDSYSRAMRIFEENEDFNHLMMAFETILGTYVSFGRYIEANETITKMKLLSSAHYVALDENMIHNYEQKLEENK